MKEETIRVLQVVTQMNRAGLESRLMDLYRVLDRSKVQFDFYTCRKEPGQFDEEIVSLGGKVYYEDPLSIGQAFGIPGRFARFCGAHPEYRVLHTHLNQWCGLVCEGAKRAGVPVRIAHSRTALAGRSGENLVKDLVKHLFASAPTHRFAVSRKAGEWLFGARACSAGKVEFYPNAIDAQKFAFDLEKRENTRRALGLGEAFTILHVGNLRKVKNHEYLFRIFQVIQNREPDSVLLLAGEGERKEALTAYASELGLSDAIRFLGSRKDIPELLCAADAFVFPSFYEGLPGSVLEAQAASLPCFISDTIAPEVVLSDLAQALSINADPALWAEKVLSSRTHTRGAELALFERSGYDVRALAERLTGFYLAASEAQK